MSVPMSWSVGANLPSIVRGPVSRSTLALYAGASNDHIALHIDSDVAQAAGYPDVFVHGMLTMAYMGQVLTQVVPQANVRSWRVRFVAVTPVNATITCSGHVLEIVEHGDGLRARVALEAVTLEGVRTAFGEAEIRV